MKFCAICQNMLYIVMDEEKSRLNYTCKNCNYTETKSSEKEGESIVVAQKRFDESSKYNNIHDCCVMDISYFDDTNSFLQYQTKDIKYDMTLPRLKNIPCPSNCKEDSEVICIKYDPVNLKYLYYCTKCEEFWKLDK